MDKHVQTTWLAGEKSTLLTIKLSEESHPNLATLAQDKTGRELLARKLELVLDGLDSVYVNYQGGRQPANPDSRLFLHLNERNAARLAHTAKSTGVSKEDFAHLAIGKALNDIEQGEFTISEPPKGREVAHARN